MTSRYCLGYNLGDFLMHNFNMIASTRLINSTIHTSIGFILYIKLQTIISFSLGLIFQLPSCHLCLLFFLPSYFFFLFTTIVMELVILYLYTSSGDFPHLFLIVWISCLIRPKVWLQYLFLFKIIKCSFSSLIFRRHPSLNLETPVSQTVFHEQSLLFH